MSALDPVYPRMSEPTRVELSNLRAKIKEMERHQQTIAHYLLVLGAGALNPPDIETLRYLAGLAEEPEHYAAPLSP